MNKEERKKMVKVVGEALEGAVLPAIYELQEDVKGIKATLKDHGEQLKDHGEQLKDHGERLDEINRRLEKVEYNTRVYPYDKEYVSERLS